VTTHGFALNVTTDVAAFARMIPCGFTHEVASLERVGVHVEMRSVVERVAVALAERLGGPLSWSLPAPAVDHEIPPDAPVRSAQDLSTAIAA